MQTFTLKGSLIPGSVLRLKSLDFDLLSNQIQLKISQIPQFFYQMPIMLDCSEIDSAKFNLEQAVQICHQNNLNLFAVTGLPATFKELVNDAGLSFITGHQQKAESELSQTNQISNTPSNTTHKSPIATTNSKIICQNIRSGQQVYAKDADLIIQGTVSNGAEVVADGNIHIYGALRGRAIAGASGNKESRIYCSKLQAELISIAGTYWLSEQIPTETQPVVVFLQQENLFINTL